MASPMSNYSRSQDSTEFLEHYKRSIVKNDPRLEFHQDIVKDFGESYERAYQLLNTFYAEAYKDVSYFLGNQWSLEELAYLNNQRRSSFTYNRQMALIHLVSGRQIKNRRAIVADPVENSSEQTATDLTDAIRSVMHYGKGYEAISSAFKSSLISGLSFLSPYLDYRNDPVSGNILFHKDDWNAVIFDPFLTKRSLEDCSFLARRKYLSRTEVISLLPDKEDVIKALPWGSRDDKFTYMPYARQWGMQKLLNYTEYWRTKWTVKDVLVDMTTGETKEWDGDRSRLKLYRKAFPQIEVIRKPVRSVELGIIVEGELLYYGKDPYGLDDYPFVPYFCIFEPSYDLFTWKIQSLCRVNRDSQTELNKRRSKLIDVVDSQLNSGWIAKTNSVSNPTSLYKSGQGQVVFLKPEAQMTDVQRLEAPNVPASYFQIESELNDDFFISLGLSRENIGMAENENVETAAILSKMRAEAGWLPMAHIFEGLRESEMLLGEKVMKMMQINYTPQKIQNMIKREPTPEFFSKMFGRYNIVVEEGVLTDTQKQAQFLQLNALKQMGIQFTDEEIVDASNLHDKKQYKERLAAQQQQQQQMQQLATQVQLQAVSSKTESDKALAAERLNKIQLDAALSAERISRAEEDRTGGMLNLIKAVKELDTIDIGNLQRKLALLREIEGQQSAREVAEQPQAPQESPAQPQLPRESQISSLPSQ
jgi:hypothetical protein